MKTILTCLLAACIGDAAAQIVSRDSLHLKSVGTAVSGSFMLVNRVVLLPEGDFTLAVTHVRQPPGQGNKMADVVVAQVVDGKLRMAVAATAVLAIGRSGGWSDEPCKREDTLYRLNRVPFMKQNYEQNCLLVNHFTNTMSQSATGSFVPLVKWLGQQRVTTPIPVTLNVSITRIQVGHYLAVHYIFNPEAFGCSPTAIELWSNSAWHKANVGKDAEKARFVDSVVEFGKEMQVRINEAFEGRGHLVQRLDSSLLRVRPCGMALQAAPTQRAKAGSAAARLRELEELKDQKLISPEEYDERRRKILDSL